MTVKHNTVLSIKELRETIKDFQSLDFEVSSIADADKLFLKIITGFHVFPLEWKEGILFRARKHTEKPLFENIKELIYPINPAKHGRFNDIGESVFYGAMNRDTAMLELRLNLGDEITLLESRRVNVKNIPLFMEIAVKELIIGQNYQPSFTRLTIERNKKLLDTEEKRIRYEIINSFLNNETTKIVSDDETYKYKTTIVIGRYYLSNKKTAGIMYPSINRNNSGCLAIRPDAYHQYFTPDKCFKCKVIGIESNGNIKLYCENGSVNIDKKGNIKWQH